jgi:hypothetical protein
MPSVVAEGDGRRRGPEPEHAGPDSCGARVVCELVEGAGGARGVDGPDTDGGVGGGGGEDGAAWDEGDAVDPFGMAVDGAGRVAGAVRDLVLDPARAAVGAAVRFRDMRGGVQRLPWRIGPETDFAALEAAGSEPRRGAVRGPCHGVDHRRVLQGEALSLEQSRALSSCPPCRRDVPN